MTESIKLRPYQQDAVDALKKHYSRRKTGCLILPTGGGKTFTTWSFLKDYVANKKKILWVVHRDYLIEQSEDAAKLICPNAKITRWTSTEKDASGDIVIAMIMSTKALTENFHWIIYDECHRSAAQSYKDLESRISYKKKLGVTATCERLDQKELGLGLKPVYQISFGELCKQGYLSKPDVRVLRTGANIQYSISGGDINKASLSSIDQDGRNQCVVEGVFKNEDPTDVSHAMEALMGDENDTTERIGTGGPRKVLVFACDIDHVNTLCEAINDQRNGYKAVGLHSRLSRREREKRLKEFGQEFNVLVNCEVFTEGFDEPDITDIVVTRPTISKALWVQMVGRGARIIQNKKDTFKLWILLDDINKFAWLVKEWVMDEVQEEVIEELLPKKIQEARIQEACRELKVNVPVIAEKLLVTALITTCGSYERAEKKIHVITRDREKCIHLLSLFMQESEIEDVKTTIDHSYGHCVTAGEFSQSEWKELAWAWYQKNMLEKSVNSQGNYIWQEKWIDRTKFVRSEMLNIYSNTKRICQKFNQNANKWVDKIGGKDNILSTWKKDITLKNSQKWMLKSITGLNIKDRVIIIKTDLGSFTPMIKSFNNAIAGYMREKLEDENLIVTLRLK